jgi:hypothetical protein
MKVACSPLSYAIVRPRHPAKPDAPRTTPVIITAGLFPESLVGSAATERPAGTTRFRLWNPRRAGILVYSRPPSGQLEAGSNMKRDIPKWVWVSIATPECWYRSGRPRYRFELTSIRVLLLAHIYTAWHISRNASVWLSHLAALHGSRRMPSQSACTRDFTPVWNTMVLSFPLFVLGCWWPNSAIAR